MLREDEKIVLKQKLTSTMSDLAVLVDAGHALLTGKATAWDEKALSKAGNMRKNAHYSSDQRGFLAFQSTLDRARTLVVQLDESGVVTVDRFDAVCSEKAKNPVDVCYQARESQVETVGHSAMAAKVRTIRMAAQILRELKEKFGDALKAERTAADIAAKRVKRMKAPVINRLVANIEGARTIHEAMGGVWTPEVEQRIVDALKAKLANPSEVVTVPADLAVAGN
jgi:hypothetical protein